MFSILPSSSELNLIKHNKTPVKYELDFQDIFLGSWNVQMLLRGCDPAF